MYGRVIVFLLGSTTLLLLVSFHFLRLALEARNAAMATTHPTESDKHNLAALSAWSSLLLAILLVILLAAMIWTFRLSRFFRLRAGGPRVTTQHVDAWAEAGKRLEADEPDEQPPPSEP
jgi:hypothetical protein